MANKRQKHPSQLADRRPSRTHLELLGPSTGIVPVPPPGLLKVSKDAWFDFWRSPAASQVNLEQHGTALRDWIRHRDEWERVYRLFRRSTMVRGSVGQLRLNPLRERLNDLRSVIDKYEAKFGLTPLDTMRLGFETGRAGLTLAELNAQLDDDTDIDQGFLEGEYAEAQ